MAFPVAVGWENLPNGVFSPTIFSREVQLAFRKETVIGAITNNKYFGEIAAYGDTVRIMKEPTIEIREYARGKNVEPQNLLDEDFMLEINRAKDFAFILEDIEEKHSHVDFEKLAQSQAAYRLRDVHDSEVLAYMAGYRFTQGLGGVGGTWAAATEAQMPGTRAIATAGVDEHLASMQLDRTDFTQLTDVGTAGDSIPLGPRLGGATALPTTYVNPTTLINRMASLLDQQYVPREGRWLVIDPVMMEILSDEDSKFLNADYGVSGALRNGLVLPRWNGFRIYLSNNLPRVGTGPGTGGTTAQNDNFGLLIAGHDSAVATAEQIKKIEKLRSQFTFADIVRGLHVWGNKILRPEALVTARYNRA
jgi:hypothetical protein